MTWALGASWLSGCWLGEAGQGRRTGFAIRDSRLLGQRDVNTIHSILQAAPDDTEIVDDTERVDDPETLAQRC